jgi:uncharacterized protein (TIGR02246 family)
MEIRLPIAFVALLISSAVPVFAQLTDTADPRAAQPIRAFTAHFAQAFNRHDAAAAAEIFTEDAVWRSPEEIIHGRQAIEERFRKYHFQQRNTKNQVMKVDRVIGFGNEIHAIGTWSNTVQESDGRAKHTQGYFTTVCVPQGDTWKIRMSIYNRSGSYYE